MASPIGKKTRRTAAALVAVGLMGVVDARALPAHAATAAGIAQAMQAPATVDLKGRVVDSSGLPVPGARVTAQPDVPAVVTDAAGEFILPLPPGIRTITIAADGFAPLSVRLNSGQAGSGRRDFTLQLAAVQESVNVTASSGYGVGTISSATRTSTPLIDVPQAVTVVTRDLIKDQLMMSMADVVRYVPGISAHQGENNRDEVVIRGNRSNADFFLNGVRDDVQVLPGSLQSRSRRSAERPERDDLRARRRRGRGQSRHQGAALPAAARRDGPDRRVGQPPGHRRSRISR